MNKVASRKRMSADLEKLRDKISKENKKIIKLKEQLRQVKTKHEKLQLQQNMLEVQMQNMQMQYETFSGQYKDELRRRAETLNKLASTVCSVLEDNSALRDILTRTKADHAAFYEAYQRSGQLLRDLKTQQIQQGEKSKQTIDSLQEKLKLTTDHHNELLKYFTEEKQRSAAELQEEKKKLNAAIGKNNELLAANTELGALAQALVDLSRKDIEMKEEAIQNLQRKIKQCIQEFNTQASEMKNNMLKAQRDLKEATSSNESLKQALHNQEAFTKTVCEQNNQLQEKLALVEEEQATSVKIVKELEAKLQNKEVELSKNLSIIMDLRADKERLNEKIESMQNKTDNIQKEITRPAISQPRIEADQDDNAVMLTPAKPRSQIPQNMSPPSPRKEPDSLLFNFLCDNSMDDNIIDANLENRRLSPVLPTLKRPRTASVPSSQGGLRHKQSVKNKDEEMMPLSQVKSSMQSKPRAFFKTRRHDRTKFKFT